MSNLKDETSSPSGIGVLFVKALLKLFPCIIFIGKHAGKIMVAYYLIIILLIFGGYSATTTPSETLPGFWNGVWHGISVSIAFIFSLFSDSVAIYATPNSGGWYDYGFILGFGFSVLFPNFLNRTRERVHKYLNRR